MLKEILIPFLTTAETIRISAPTVVESMIGNVRREACNRRLKEWSEYACHLANVDLHIQGLENFNPDRTYILMSNHQSSYDIFTIMKVFPGTLRMVSKIEIFRVPILGPAMYAAEFIPLDRSDHQRARKGLEYAKGRLESGVNVWIAPEGTRSDDGKLLPFKKGGFMLALQTGFPILPLTVLGTRNVLSSKGWRVTQNQRVDIFFHPPIESNLYELSNRDVLIEDVRTSIESALPDQFR